MSASNNPLRSINPSTGEAFWDGQRTSEDELNSIVSQAAKAHEKWQSSPVDARKNLLINFAEKLSQYRSELAELISREMGKPLWEAITEVNAMIGKIPVTIKAHEERTADFSNGNALTRFRPHGVVAVYGPFNFPGHLPNGHICPAILAGNAVIFKPSELTSATAELTLRIWRESGLPNNLIQVVYGGAEIASPLANHRGLNGLFFTGSEKVGSLLAQQFAKNPGRILALELGGNNPLIVDCDHITDLKTAALLAVQSVFITSGQRCTCARRLILPKSPNAGEFLEILVDITRHLKIDAPDASTPPFMGPVVSSSAADAVLDFQKTCLSMGAIPIISSQRGAEETGFVTPGILDVSKAYGIPDEECFGPLLQVIQTSDFDAAIKVANDTRFGLASGLFSDSKEHYDKFYQQSRAGIINWNQPLTGASSSAPFGGIGASGNFRPSAFFAADYCSYPVASMENSHIDPPTQILPGIELNETFFS